jgi:DNA topoisomerase IB
MRAAAGRWHSLCSTALMRLMRAVMNGDPVAAATSVELRYCCDESPGLHRIRRRKQFSYRSVSGAAVRDVATLSRIRALAIPPAWTDVWISPDPCGHIRR